MSRITLIAKYKEKNNFQLYLLSSKDDMKIDDKRLCIYNSLNTIMINYYDREGEKENLTSTYAVQNLRIFLTNDEAKILENDIVVLEDDGKFFEEQKQLLEEAFRIQHNIVDSVEKLIALEHNKNV